MVHKSGYWLENWIDILMDPKQEKWEWHYVSRNEHKTNDQLYRILPRVSVNITSRRLTLAVHTSISDLWNNTCNFTVLVGCAAAN